MFQRAYICFFFLFFFTFCMNSTLEAPPRRPLHDNPTQQTLLTPEGLLVPLNLFANSYNRSWLRAVMSHSFFYHLQLDFENNQVSNSPLCSSLTDSRWGTLRRSPLKRRGAESMSLLTDTGANLNCLRSGLAFVFRAECLSFLMGVGS